MHSYQHNIKTFNNATRHLTRVERSLYRDLIELYYDTEQPLNACTKKLQRLVIAQTEEEKEALNYVLSEFFELTGDFYTHSFCDEVIESYKNNTSKKAAAGKASAEARRKKAEALKAKRTNKGEQNSTPVEHPLNKCATNQKPETRNHKPNTTARDSADSPHSIWEFTPDKKIIEQITTHFLIPEKFVDEKLFEFKTYWSGREELPQGYNSRFVADIQISWKKNKHAWLETNEQEKLASDETAPCEKIIELYHEHLPELAQVIKLTASRKAAISRLWLAGESGLPTLESWIDFFKHIRNSPFLMGLAPPMPGRDRPFKADFDWIIDESNSVKICERKFHG